MRKQLPTNLTVFSLAFGVAATCLALTAPTLAQSGTRQNVSPGSGSRLTAPSAPAAHSAPAKDVADRSGKQAPVALEGFSPVSILNSHQWVKGSPNHQTVFDGHTYLFASAAEQKMFAADPGKYVPCLGGDCIISYASMGQRRPGNIRHALFYAGRLVLFANEQAKQMFAANPAKFANAELAFGGKCAVCRVDMHQAVAGKPEYTVFYKGLRYMFPGAEQQKMFIAQPAKYADRGPVTSAPASGGSSSR